MGAGVGVLEAAAPLVGGMAMPWEGPAPPAGGPSSILGICGVRPVVLRMNNAARQAWTAGAMWVLVGRASGSIRDRPATCLHHYVQSGSG